METEVKAATVAAVEVVTDENPQSDLAPLSQQELCDLLHSELENRPINQLRDRVDEIKNLFYKLVKQADYAARDRFILEGGAAADFTPEVSALEVRFKELLALYRNNRNEHTASSEEQKEENHRLKLQIIEELKALVGSTETMGATFSAFKDLQDRWRSVGSVPVAVNKDLWDTYHHHTENFYNYVQINRELRDMDLRRNYDGKLALCERAEALAGGEVPVLEAFAQLQLLHDQYRELGPVAADQKEELWNRFKAASTVINKLHQAHHDQIKEQQLANLAQKTALCEELESLFGTEITFDSAKAWNTAQESLIAVQTKWRAIGFAPKKDNNSIYARFKATSDKFFDAKREYFAGIRSQQGDALARKTELCEAVEALVDSTDWKATGDRIIQLQKDWKSAGTVGRAQSDALWKRFRAACDKFFERRAEQQQDNRSKSKEIVDAKRAVMAELEALKGSESLTFERLKELMHNYGAAGHLPPRLKAELEVEFKAICDSLFEELRGREGAERIEKFRQRVAQGGAQAGMQGAKNPERDQLNRRLNTLQGELKTLENNIGFFGMSKGAESLKADVERKIMKVRADISEVQQKLKILAQAGN